MSHAAANLAFKSRYTRRLETTLALGLLLHLAVILAVPPYSIAPYRLPEESIFEGIDLPPEIDILPPPPEPARPPILEMELSDIAPPEATLAPNVTDVFKPVTPPPIDRARAFVAEFEDARLLKAVEPVYPTLARAAQAEGDVWVEVLVDERGRVAEARIIRAEAVSSLQKAALQAARGYLFSPARQRGKPVPVRLVIPFNFRLH